jgi:hypothetical protein
MVPKTLPQAHILPENPGAERTTGRTGTVACTGTWRFTTGQRDVLIKTGPIPTGNCNHRWQARSHDPGVMLRHLVIPERGLRVRPSVRPSTRGRCPAGPADQGR